MKTGVRVADAMTTTPKSIHPTATIKQCAEQMKKENIGSLLVLENEKLIGIITETDLIQKAITENVDINIQVSSIMTTSLTSITPEADIYEALKLMQQNQVTRLPVIDNKKLVGILTIKDVIKVQPQIIEWLIETHRLLESTNKAYISNDYVEGECELCENTGELNFYKGKWLCSDCKRRYSHGQGTV